MDFDRLLIRYLGTADLARLSQTQLLAGIETLRTQFGIEADTDERFAIWCLLYMLAAAPDVETAFDDPSDREAAQDFADAIDQDEDE